MKICFIVNKCDFFYSHRFELAKELSSLGEIYLIADFSNVNNEIIKKIARANIKMHPVQKRNVEKGFIGVISYFSRLFRAVKIIKPKAILFVTLEISVFGVILGWFNKKIISLYLITGFGQFFFKKHIRNRFLYFIYKFLFLSSKRRNNSKFVFQNSEDMNIFIQKKLAAKENSVLIHGSGINIEQIKLHKRVIRKSPTFLFSSRLVKAKGVREFLQATKTIKNTYPKVSINIAGKHDLHDSDRISNALLNEIQNSRYINYFGEVSHDDMQCLYKKSDIFVLPSYGEGLPKAALEAAATGMPLILSKTSGCFECIENEKNGIFVEMHNVNSLINAMDYFINRPNEVIDMGINSRTLIEKKFSLKRISNLYKDLLCEIK